MRGKVRWYIPLRETERERSVLAELEPQPRYLEDSFERVVGGHVARPNSWPWQISLQYRSGSRYYHTCGGTLIEKGWVMTAAHCVDSARTWRVVIGEHDLNSNSGREQIKEVANVYIHPGWDSNRVSKGYDIALLRLSSDATLNSYVQLGSLPPSGQILPHNNLCYITGWGRTSTGGSLSAQLKQAHLPLVDHKTCTSTDWWGSIVKSTMVCGGGGAESGCNGDSGGPLNCLVNEKYYVHGIASFVSSYGCNYPKKPTSSPVCLPTSNGWTRTRVLAELEPQPRYLEDDSVEERVVGGEVARPNSWPWQISLQYKSGSSFYHTCGGTLVKRGWVMTAAHCVDRYDIALLRLSSDATLNNYVQLGALPPSGQVLPHNNNCYITGWGRTKTGGQLSAQLKQAYLPTVDHKTCSSYGWWGSTVKDTMVCAGGGSESGCQGDSGGPLNCNVSGRWVVHGVTSFVSSSGCNAYRKPTVFTRVSAYISWMNGKSHHAFDGVQLRGALRLSVLRLLLPEDLLVPFQHRHHLVMSKLFGIIDC
ncbi:hypothetical protein INR49_014042 [Caranx melampygus]|nr:hypothetical protein INR49_014042 [Caranx melampygus]